MSYTGCCGLGNGLIKLQTLPQTLQLPEQWQPKQELCYDSSGNIRVPCDYPGALQWYEAGVPAAAARQAGVVPPDWRPGDPIPGVTMDTSTIPEDEPAPPPPPEKPNYLLWGSIIGGSVLVVGGGAYWFMKKKGR